MQYHLAPLFCRPWTLNGMSPRLIESHYENNYGGALNRLNAITEELEALDPATTPRRRHQPPEARPARALNSTLLHELYFASLGGDGRARAGGDGERARPRFRLGRPLAPRVHRAGRGAWRRLGLGAADLRAARRPADQSERLRSRRRSIAGGIPILALDMYEHAYHLDFGANADRLCRRRSCATSTGARSQGRYEDATKVAPPRPLVQKEFADVPAVTRRGSAGHARRPAQPVQIIDTRPRHYSTKAQDIMDGAVWRDPERVEEWIGELSKDEPVVTFCVYGFHIGCQTAVTLRKAGFDARYMAGGHYGWKAAKGPVKLFEPTASANT